MVTAPASALGRGPEEIAGPGSGSLVRSLGRNAAQLVGSHAGLGATGLACFPILAANLGQAGYGDFSLFLTLAGLAVQLDFARPLLVRELARGGTLERHGHLVGTCAIVQFAVALAAGWLLLGPLGGACLAGVALLGALASAPYAALSAEDRVGRAGALRNGLWAAAFVGATALSFVTARVELVGLAFLAASLALLFVYRSATRRSAGPWIPRPELTPLRSWRDQIGDIAAFSAANAVVVATDRVALRGNASGETFGAYAGQADLAIKLNMCASAIGAALLPVFARAHGSSGHSAAARSFVRIASWIALGYFAIVLTLILLQEQLVQLVLPPDFASAARVLPLVLVGVFVHLFGFLVTPWQRACGDYTTHRRVYVAAALWTLVAGVVLVPTFGAWGAVATYLSARVAELVLVAIEASRLPRQILPLSRLAVLAAMVVTLAVVAALQVQASGGAA